MKKQFIVNTPFGIGFATSGKDLKDMLSFVEGIAGEGAERSEAQQEEACDCENCQGNARVSEKKLAGLTELLASVDDLDILRFMENDAIIHRNAAAIGLGEDHPQVAHLEKVVSHVQERITELTGESDADKVEDKSTWEKRDPSLLGLYHVSSTIEIGTDILASVDLGYTVDKEEMTNFVRQSTEILNELLKSEIAGMDAPETPVEDYPAEGPEQEEPLPTLEEIKAMTDYDEVDKLQIELEGELSHLYDKKRALLDEVHAEMKRIEDLHAAAANQKAVIIGNKADIARADMADKVKALQEAIERSQPHLLIHDDIREAMEILRERYSKQ